MENGFSSAYVDSELSVRLVWDSPSSSELRERIISDAAGDALDSVLCALCVAICVREPTFPAPCTGMEKIYEAEGCVYS